MQILVTVLGQPAIHIRYDMGVKTLSLVIPIHNEQDNILPLARAIAKALKGFKYEVIWVDDGSTDSSWKKLQSLANKTKLHKLIQLRKNFGQTAALSAGFEVAVGEVVVAMDGDLQNDPADIPKLITKLEEGFDVVSGWRQSRQDAFIRVFPSRLANWFIARVSGVGLHDFGCTLKAYKAWVIKDIRLYGEMHRFIPAVAAQRGAKIGELPVKHHLRKHGVSKYGLDRSLRVILDVILVKFLLSFYTRPLHLFGGLGILGMLGGGVIFTLLVYERLVFNSPLADRPLFLVSVFMIMLGVQFITLGILAEIMMRVYYESQGKRPYVVGRRENIG